MKRDGEAIIKHKIIFKEIQMKHLDNPSKTDMY